MRVIRCNAGAARSRVQGDTARAHLSTLGYGDPRMAEPTAAPAKPGRAHEPLRSPSYLAVLKALAGARRAFPPLERSREVEVKGRDGKPGYKFRYAPLDKIHELVEPVLEQHGLTVIQNQVRYPEGPVLRTELWHLETGEFIATEIDVVPTPGGMAAYGGVLTYARRYCLSIALNLVTETDDDALGLERESRQRRDSGKGATREQAERAGRDPEIKAKPGDVRKIRQAIIATGRTEDAVVAHYADRFHIQKLEELPASAVDFVLASLKKPVAKTNNQEH